ncbi:MAG: polysaccharide deacetylase [Betaproteobacteria bacterium]|nr:polysaccharide deacetylase [Betaproteobacteria bacterium]
MSKHIICLTFDFDGISGFISRGQVGPSWISRGEFGPRVAAPRLIELFQQYDIRTSWYVPGHTIETWPEAVKMVINAGHELAHHGWTHRPPASLSAEEEERELIRANEAIKKISGQYARGYRSPSWDLSPYSIPYFLKHGFVYDSSMMGDDYTPYYARHGDVIEMEQPALLGEESAIVEMPIHWSTDDSPHYEFVRGETSLRQGLKNAHHVEQNWVDDFCHMRDTVPWGVLTYTCHPFISGRGHRIMVLERLIRRLKNEGAVFLRVDEAVAQFKRRNPKPP